MTRFFRQSFVAAAALSLISLTSLTVATAQDAAEPTEEARAAARAAYGNGQRLFREGQFVEAEAAFDEAYAAVPNPVVLLGIAESRERQGNLVGAVEALEAYLAGRPDAPDRESVESRMAAMRATPSTLAVSSEPAGAAIFLDGVDTGEVTPADFETTAGAHTITLRQDGFDEGTEAVTATFGTRHEVAITLTQHVEPATLEGDGEPVEEVPLDDDDDDEDEDEGPSAAVWATSGIAAASLVTGTVLGFLALTRESEFDDAPDEATADQGERFALFADVAFGIAAVSAITAVVIFLTAGDDDEEEEEDEGATAHIAPVVGPRSGGVTAVVEF